VEADERIKCFVLVPKHIDRTVPAIFAHHQHASQFHLGKSEVVGLEGDPNQAYASELAERGYVVIAPDALGFEERNWSNPHGYAEYFELATRLVQGKTLLSNCLHDISVALDYLMTRSEIDPLRIGFIGHSYGGKMAIWAIAKATMIAGMAKLNIWTSMASSIQPPMHAQNVFRSARLISAYHAVG